MHEVLVNRLGGLSLPRKSVVRLTDRPDMTLDVYRGRKTTNQQSTINIECISNAFSYVSALSFHFVRCVDVLTSSTSQRQRMRDGEREGEGLVV